MLFNFHLCPFNQISPWGKPGDLSLHWYGLSFGYYWLDAGAVELLRYNPALVDLWARKYPGANWLPDMPYVDYQVARLWDDVIEILPAVLEPVPLRLARALTLKGPWANWLRSAEAALREHMGASLTLEDARNLLYEAGRWWGRRSLDTAYLQAGAEIACWGDGAEVHIAWDNRGLMLEGLPAWDAQFGEYRLPVAAFLDEVHAFDTRFIRRMHDRVALAQVNWTRPDVTLDPGINVAQEKSAQYLNWRMQPSVRRELDDWDHIYEAIAQIEALPSFPAQASLGL